MTLKFRIIVGCLLVFAVIAVWGILKGYNHVDNFTSLDKYDSYLKQAYPEVEHISTDTLQALLKSDDNLLLVDCRKPEEYAISRITGAVNLSSAEAIEEHFKKLGSPPSSVVVYSAVGRRAVEIGREISKSNSQIPIKSYTKSFFFWANMGLLIIDENGQPTKNIHSFQDRWSRFLEGDLQPLQ